MEAIGCICEFEYFEFSLTTFVYFNVCIYPFEYL